MSNICPICGLTKELCVCEEIAKEAQRITVRLDERRYGKQITLIECGNSKDIDLKEIAKTLKTKFACGGTVKNGIIELQGNHVKKVKDEMVKLGFNADTIDIKG